MSTVRPKKHLGQHFLNDRRTAERIVNLLEAGPEMRVIEIGPGRGVLTAFLLDKYPLLRMVEIDPEAAAYIQSHFAAQSPDLVLEDVLRWDLASGAEPDSSFIGNLPYNISSPIFFRLLEHTERVKEGVFMVQREVAQRLCAGPGGKDYGILSVLLGQYYTLKYAFTVPPGAFSPPPKVHSAVFRMERREFAEPVDFAALKTVVKAAFNQRRKTLRNALKGLNIGDFEGKALLLDKRAEQLPVSDFVRFAHALQR